MAAGTPGTPSTNLACLAQMQHSLGYLGVNLALPQSLSLYPTAMRAGAASMLPGGNGLRRPRWLTLLAGFAVPLSTGALVAIGIRLATLWFAMLLGIVAMLLLAQTNLCDANGHRHHR